MNFNEPLRTAKQLYRVNGGNFPADLDWLMQHGVVVNTPETFLMGHFFREGDPKRPCELKNADGAFVVLCAGKPKPALHQLVEMVRLLAYERAFRGDPKIRVIDIKKYYSKL
jgi:hypothetical protein